MFQTLRVHAVLFFVTLIYAITFTVAKDVMPTYLGSQAFVFFRIGGALLLFWIAAPFEHLVFASNKSKKIQKQDLFPLLIASIFGVAFNMSMFFKGLSLTYPINGAVLMLNTPIFVVIIARILGQDKLTPRKIAGILIAAIGAAWLMSGKGAQFTAETLWGDLLITVNAVFYAYYLVYVKKLLQKYTVITVSKWTFLLGFIMVSPLAIPELRQVDFSLIPSHVWGEIVFIIIGTTFLAYLLNAWAIEKAGPVLVGSYIYLQPLLAGIIAIYIGSDSFSIAKFGAAIAIFTGVFLTSDKQQAILKDKLLKRRKNKAAASNDNIDR